MTGIKKTQRKATNCFHLRLVREPKSSCEPLGNTGTYKKCICSGKLKEKEGKENGEHCVTRRFVVYALDEILLG
jgi:hypothetical protein